MILGKTSHRGIPVRRLIAALLAIQLVGCFGPTDEERAIAEEKCPEFIAENVHTVPGMGSVNTRILDVYKKNGRVVAEVGYRQGYSSSDSYSVRLCVIDLEKNTLTAPGLINASQWQK